jgi:hypothetical protein
MKKKVIAWKVGAANPRIASVRYRCLMPIEGLTERGISSVVLETGETVRDFSDILALIFVKSFSREDAVLAARAREASVPIILDLCDHIFIKGYREERGALQYGEFESIAAGASIIVTSTDELGKVVLKQLSSSIPVIEIPWRLAAEPANETTAVVLDMAMGTVSMADLSHENSQSKGHITHSASNAGDNPCSVKTVSGCPRSLRLGFCGCSEKSYLVWE